MIHTKHILEEALVLNEGIDISKEQALNDLLYISSLDEIKDLEDFSEESNHQPSTPYFIFSVVVKLISIYIAFVVIQKTLYLYSFFNFGGDSLDSTDKMYPMFIIILFLMVVAIFFISFAALFLIVIPILFSFFWLKNIRKKVYC